jgi:hypothetical protein
MTESPPVRRVGDIVNGYRWDGRQWVPLTPGPATYPVPQPQPGPGVTGYRAPQPQWPQGPPPAQPLPPPPAPQAPRPVWTAPQRTVASPPSTGGWTPPSTGGWTPPRPPAWTPPGAPVAAIRGGKRTWLWALVALAVVVVGYAVISSGGSPGGGGDAAVKAGVSAIARGCSAYAGDNGSGPGVSDVRPDGAVAQYVGSWPTNPFTGGPMTPGTQPGDYHFSTAIRMPGGEYRGYVLGVLSNGETYSVEFNY